MFTYITEHFFANWRRFMLPMVALVLATMVFYMTWAVRSYADRAVDYSAEHSLTTADLLAYNDQLTGIEFLETLQTLDTVESAYFPMTVWGHVIVDDRSTQISLRSVPPQGMQREQFYTGSYPHGEGEIALPVRLAEYLGVETGDSLVVTFPSIGEAGVAKNVRVSGTYSYSILGDSFTGSLNAIIGMDLTPFWDTSTGRFPLTQEGVFVVGESDVSIDELKDSLLAIRGTVAETRPERAEKHRQQHIVKVANFDRPIGALLVLPVLGVIIVLLLTGRTLMRDRKESLQLLNTLGASNKRIFASVLLQLMLLSAVAISLGLALGHGLTVIVHHALMDAPGSRFLPPGIDARWSIIAATAALGYIIAFATAIPVALYAVRTSKATAISSNTSRQTARHGLALIAIFVTLTVLLVFLAAAITRQTLGLTDLLTSPRLIPAVAFSLVVVFALLGLHHLAGRLVRKASVALHQPVSISTERDTASRVLRSNSARVTSWLTILASAIVAALLASQASGGSYYDNLARNITPYDISIQAPNSTEFPLSGEAVKTISNFDFVDRSLPVYSESLAIVTDGEPTGRSIFVYAVERSEASTYFPDGSDLTAGLTPGTILMPRDVLAYLGMDGGQDISLVGPKAQRATLHIAETASPWVIMTRTDLEILAGIQGPSELWVELDEYSASNPGLAFIDTRSALINTGFAENYRVASAVTPDVISVITDPPWATPFVFSLVAIALALAIFGTVRTQSLSDAHRVGDTQLIRSLGINANRALASSLMTTLVRVAIDIVIGLLIGVSLYLVGAQIGIFGENASGHVALPLKDFALIAAVGVAFAGVVAIIQHLVERSSWYKTPTNL